MRCRERGQGQAGAWEGREPWVREGAEFRGRCRRGWHPGVLSVWGSCRCSTRPRTELRLVCGLRWFGDCTAAGLVAAGSLSCARFPPGRAPVRRIVFTPVSPLGNDLAVRLGDQPGLHLHQDGAGGERSQPAFISGGLETAWNPGALPPLKTPLGHGGPGCCQKHQEREPGAPGC